MGIFIDFMFYFKAFLLKESQEKNISNQSEVPRKAAIQHCQRDYCTVFVAQTRYSA